MKIIRYGLTLHRLSIDDIELVRQHRNSEEINKYMEYKEYITPEMQLKWFQSIDNVLNWYYIIEFNNKKIGLISERLYQHGIHAESGMFIWDQEFIGTMVPTLASLILMEIGFYIIGGKESVIRVLKSNDRAIQYNKMLGYELCEKQENIENQLYKLTKDDFIKNTKKLRKAALQFSGNDNLIELYFSNNDYLSGIAQVLEQVFTQPDFSNLINCEILPDGKRYYSTTLFM